MMKMIIVGGGNMGGAIALAIKDVVDLTIVEKQPSRISFLSKKGLRVVKDLNETNISTCNFLMMAVKPQVCDEILQSIKGKTNKNLLFISIMAGVSIKRIYEISNIKKIVRLMPNLPVQVNNGVTGAVASKEFTEESKKQLTTILEKTGKVLWLDNESMIDACTAISGSGPAYVFYFMNSMFGKAIELGFTPEQAKILVQGTFSGAVKTTETSEDSYAELITKVQSKGGTTESAITSFDENKIDDFIKEGINAAYRRAKNGIAKSER